MELKELQQHWDAFGRKDPFWAILSNSDKKDRKWDCAEFFETGRAEIAKAMAYVARLGFPLLRGSAVDFGCGVGRETQALCEHFDQCYGVDIAPSMLQLAREYNRHGSRCHYILNASNDLRVFQDNSFDFVYSHLVLQHMKPEYSLNYIREFIRMLAPGGLLLFQLPSELARPENQHQTGQAGFGAPLPDDAFKAQIRPQASFMTGKTCSQLTLKVAVRNLSAFDWTSQCIAGGKYRVRLGNRWLDESGRLLVVDEARANLPHDLKPTEEIDLTLSMNTPVTPGIWVVELDMVQESVAWFRDKGSETAKVRVELNAHDGGASEDTGSDSEMGSLLPSNPRQEMYGVSPETVLEVIASAGVKLIHTQENQSAFPWRGFRYCATKGPNSTSSASAQPRRQIPAPKGESA